MATIAEIRRSECYSSLRCNVVESGRKVIYVSEQPAVSNFKVRWRPRQQDISKRCVISFELLLELCQAAGCHIPEGTVLPTHISEGMSFLYAITKIELHYQFIIELS